MKQAFGLVSQQERGEVMRHEFHEFTLIRVSAGCWPTGNCAGGWWHLAEEETGSRQTQEIEDQDDCEQNS